MQLRGALPIRKSLTQFPRLQADTSPLEDFDCLNPPCCPNVIDIQDAHGSILNLLYSFLFNRKFSFAIVC